VFQNPNDLNEYVRTEDILTSNMSADSFKRRLLKPYYDDYAKSSVKVTKTNYDELGAETTDPTLIKTSVYRVEVNKRISGFSFAGLRVLNDP